VESVHENQTWTETSIIAASIGERFAHYRTLPHTITRNTLIYIRNIQTTGSFTQYASGYPPHTHTTLPH
jgi:hypothetical protein